MEKASSPVAEKQSQRKVIGLGVVLMCATVMAVVGLKNMAAVPEAETELDRVYPDNLKPFENDACEASYNSLLIDGKFTITSLEHDIIFLFDKCDRNKDDQLNQGEWNCFLMGMNDRWGSNHKVGGKMFFDFDGNGVMSRDEVQISGRDLIFGRYDANGDGVLSLEEVCFAADDVDFDKMKGEL